MKIDNPIFILAGKSLSGKTTLIKELERNKNIKRFITTTTRPPRPGEKNGHDYFFISNEQFDELNNAGLIVAPRIYEPAKETKDKKWCYGLDANLLKNSDKTQIVVTDLKGIIDLKDYFNNENVHVIYLDVSIEEQLSRSKLRDEKYRSEQMRRIQADMTDFVGIKKHADLVLKAEKPINENMNLIIKFIDYIEALGAYKA